METLEARGEVTPAELGYPVWSWTVRAADGAQLVVRRTVDMPTRWLVAGPRRATPAELGDVLSHLGHPCRALVVKRAVSYTGKDGTAWGQVFYAAPAD